MNRSTDGHGVTLGLVVELFTPQFGSASMGTRRAFNSVPVENELNYILPWRYGRVACSIVPCHGATPWCYSWSPS